MALNTAGIPEIDEGWQVRSGASTLVDKLQLVSDRATDIKDGWAALAAPYQAPEQGLVLQAMDEPATSAAELWGKGGRARSALDSYGDELDRLKTERATLIADIQAFQAEKAEKDENGGGFLGHEDWLLGESRDLLGKEEDLSGRISAFAEAVDAAQRTCANALNAIWGGPEWLAADRADAGYEYVYGLNSESYDQLQLSGDVPWGTPDEWTEGDWTTKAYMFGRGAVRSVTDLVEFGGVLIGVGAEDGETSAAWSGLGQMAKDLAVLAVPLPLLPAVAGTQGGRDALSTAGNRLLEMGKSAIGYGTWGTSGWNTAGSFAPDIIAAVFTGGSAAAVKSGLKSAAASTLTRSAPSAATRVIDLGDAFRRTLDTPINGLRNLGDSIRNSFRNPLDGNGPGTDLPDTSTPDVEAPVGRGGPDTDAPDTDSPGTDAPAGRGPDTDAPDTDAPAGRGPDTDAPDTDAPAGRGPDTDAPDTDAPAGRGDSDTDAPDGEAPAGRGPDTDAPAGRGPDTDTPDTDAPDTDAPDTDAPAGRGDSDTDAPDGEAPAGRGPDTDAPAGRGPDTDAPDTDAPAARGGSDTDSPSTREPDAEAPSTRTPEGEAWPPGRAPGDDVAPPVRPDYDGDPESGMLGRPPETSGPPMHVDRGDPLMPGPRQRFGDGLGPGDLPPNTEIVVRGRGVFYTDEQGVIRFVEPIERTMRADGKTPLKNTPMIPELRDPLPNTTYLVDNNGFFHTDSVGRTDHVHVDDLQWIPEADRRHSGAANRNVTGGDSLFDAGHLWPKVGGGRPEEINLVQMLREINQGSARRHGLGEYTVARLERELMDAMKSGSKVTWDVQVRYPDVPDNWSELDRAARREHSVPEEFVYEPMIDGEPVLDDEFIIIPNA